jgi:hypothetical protein
VHLEWLLALTCAGYVAPYAWDRYREAFLDWCVDVRTYKSRQPQRRHTLPDGSHLLLPARIEFKRLTFTQEEQLAESLRNAVTNAGSGTSMLRNSIRYETSRAENGVISASIASSWCAPANPGYVFTSGDKNCRTCVNTRTMRDRTDRYECTGDCLPTVR